MMRSIIPMSVNTNNVELKYGSKYGAEYVNNLYCALHKNYNHCTYTTQIIASGINTECDNISKATAARVRHDNRDIYSVVLVRHDIIYTYILSTILVLPTFYSRWWMME